MTAYRWVCKSCGEPCTDAPAVLSHRRVSGHGGGWPLFGDDVIRDTRPRPGSQRGTPGWHPTADDRDDMRGDGA